MTWNNVVQATMNALPWILPPLLGAVIGYLTNAVAIRMLFRPLRPWRVFGVRVPFTPGVIPRRRDELAESIGRMVSRELLTPDVFSRRFGSSDFGKTLRRLVVRLVDRLALVRVGEVRARLEVDALIDAVAGRLERAWCDAPGESEVQRVPEWLSPVVDLVAETLSSSEVEINALLHEALADGRVLATVDDEKAGETVERLWPAVRDQLEAILRSQPVQAEMFVRARRILHYSLDQLTSFQRLFVSAAQYDRQLETRIPSIVARSTTEILQALDAPGTRGRVSAAVVSWLDLHRNHRMEELVGPKGVDTIATAITSLVTDTDRVRSALLRAIAAVRHPDRCRRMVQRGVELVKRGLDDRADRTLGSLVPTIPRRRASIARWAVEKTQTILERATSTFVAQLDVHRVVVERINDLDIEQVEGLLLGIIRRHLKWINVFGALLGALIGGIQIVLRAIGLA